MKYKCLVLDHDDTAVKSTPELHYPSFQLIMKELRPEHKEYSLAEFTHKCFDPGFAEFCTGELCFTETEMQREYEIWKAYIQDKTPAFYEGFLDLARRFQKEGGYLCVVSHSEKAEIVRHYRENGIELDLVYGWELLPEQRKPYPYPMEQILQSLSLLPQECLMVDDLRLGYDMAKACGVEFAAAGWSHGLLPEVAEFMKQHSDYYFKTVKEFADFLFCNTLQAER